MQNRGYVIDAYGPDDVIWFPKMGRLRRAETTSFIVGVHVCNAESSSMQEVRCYRTLGWSGVACSRSFEVDSTKIIRCCREVQWS